jgi:hypothetical protein
MPMRLSPSRRSSAVCGHTASGSKRAKTGRAFRGSVFFMPEIRIALPKIAEPMDFGLFPVVH